MHSARSLSLIAAWVFAYATASLMSSTTLYVNAGVAAGVVLVAAAAFAFVSRALCQKPREAGGSDVPERGMSAIPSAIGCFGLGALSLIGSLSEVGAVRCWCIVAGFVLALGLTASLRLAGRGCESREVLASVASASGFLVLLLVCAGALGLNSSGGYWCTLLLALSSLLPFAAGAYLLVGKVADRQMEASSYWAKAPRHENSADEPKSSAHMSFFSLALAILAVVSFLSGFMLSPFNVDNVKLLFCLYAAAVITGVPLAIMALRDMYSARAAYLVPMVFCVFAVLASIAGLVVFLSGTSGRFAPLALVLAATAFALTGGCIQALLFGDERARRARLVLCLGAYVAALFAGVGFRQLVGVDEANIMFLMIGSLVVLLIAVSVGAIVTARSSMRDLSRALSHLSSSQEIVDREKSRRVEAETLASEETSRRIEAEAIVSEEMSRRAEAEALAHEAMLRRAEAESMAHEAKAAVGEAKRAALSAHEQTAELELALAQANAKMSEANEALADARSKLREADMARQVAERAASEIIDAAPSVARARVAQARSEALARFGLTKRETEIALILLGGLTVEGISARLGISANTVRFHCKNIYRKCGVNNRESLADLVEAGSAAEPAIDA